MGARPTRSVFAVMLAVLLAPSHASAANGSKPRVPVTWSEAPCATVIDRSIASALHFDYTVEFEDLGPRTDDEVDDSRTHQFFAFSRIDYPAVGTAQRLPPWISNADITRAAMEDPAVVPSQIASIDVLETTTRFAAAEWLRITADDERLPISDEQATMGVDWDVSMVAPGVYTIWGYTWEPLTNLWAPRPGFVKVIASASAADDAGPGLALLPDSEMVTVGEPHPIAGCADVPLGSTVTIEWGVVQGPVEPAWETLVVDAPISTGALAVDLVLPDHAADDGPGERRVRLRATVTDPSGRQYVAYSPAAYEVVGLDEPEPEMPEDDGCGCTSGRGHASVLALLLLVGRRRRPRERGGLGVTRRFHSTA